MKSGMQRPGSFWQQIVTPPRGVAKRHLLIAIALALLICFLYYIGDGLLTGHAGGLSSFLKGQAYHELLLLLFSGVIIYTAVTLRTRWALALSLTGFILTLPHALFIPAYSDPMYRVLSWLTINALLSLVISGALNAREQQQLYLRDIINAQERERHRLSRELHDETAQGLIDAAHSVDEMLESSPRLPENLAASLHSLRGDIDDILEGTRRAIQGLQPPLLDEIGIKPSLLWLCDSLTEESGIEVDADIDLSEEMLTQEAKIVLFRVTQEALANVKKHSGASRVELGLKTKEHRAILTISDNGRGFIPPSRGKLRSQGKSGLVGIQGRVSLVHGFFDLRSKAGEGTTVRIEIPLLDAPQKPC